MSICLGFRVNGTFLCWFREDEPIVEALSPFETKWTECTYNDLMVGHNELEKEISYCKEEITRLEKVAQHLTKREDLEQVYLDVDKQKKWLEEKIEAMAYISMLLRIQEDAATKDVKNPLEWCYG